MSASAGGSQQRPSGLGLSRRVRPALLSWRGVRLPSARTIERAAIGAMLALTTLAYASAHAHHFAVVHNPEFPDWWNWNDQGKYLRAAQAWAAGRLDPDLHWYFPGYPLLGAAFLPLTPGQPFYLVDLLCLLVFGALFVQLSQRLAPDVRFARIYGAVVFTVTVALSKYELKAFVEPWTTTATAPLSLAAMLLAFRLWERPEAGRAAALGLATGTVFLFRPADTAPLALAVAATTAFALRRLRWRLVGRLSVAGAAGAAVPLVLAGVIYLAIFGLQQSQYLQQSGQTGFEWRLIPLRWITIFVSPLPEFRDEFSLSQTFPWIIPGVAGMIACLVCDRPGSTPLGRESPGQTVSCRGRLALRHVLVVSAVTLHCALYLAYRDLHPQGLFRFSNYHYFKWCIPVFGLYAVLLVTQVARAPRRWTAWAAGLVSATLLFSWRMSWREVPFTGEAPSVQGVHTLVLSETPQSVRDGVFVPASGGFGAIYLDSYDMKVGATTFHSNADFKAFPVPDGLIFTVLRRMPPDRAAVTFSDSVRLGGQPRLLHAQFVFRRPHLAEVIATYSRRWFNPGT
jgi:hypothetical protein